MEAGGAESRVMSADDTRSIEFITHFIYTFLGGPGHIVNHLCKSKEYSDEKGRRRGEFVS